jgi:HTH-type transcriptional repressor of NAD biosynthesis genes
MKTGFVFGKFLPLHTGHLALIDFGSRYCDVLHVILCYTTSEPIDGTIRKNWLLSTFNSFPNIHIISFQYDEQVLPNSSESSENISKLWSAAFKNLLPDVNIVFTSEEYGDYVASFMGIEHLMFDRHRLITPISGSAIRKDPFLHWNSIAPVARPYFVKKIVLIGTESTGKSTITHRLASYFQTAMVPEMARDIIEKTDECTYEDLYRIATLHASAIIDRLPLANKLLFVDTDIKITQSYSLFLFGKELVVDEWIEEANRFDLYLFLQPDCDFVQDGTRLPADDRLRLSSHHNNYFLNNGVDLCYVGGNWENRFEEAIEIIKKRFFI